MKLIKSNKPSQKAFTLIEMIGVLAVIAILAALLVPKVFSAINEARVNGVSITVNTVKSATADHYGKYGTFNSVFGTNILGTSGLITNNFDNILMAEGFIDKPFTTKVGTNAVLQLVAAGTDNNSAGYALDGSTISTTNGSFVVQAVVSGVSKQDAKDLNDLIDGIPLGAATGSADSKGRVEYASGDPTTVYIYVTHR
jgi:prepilin-type N-terminal cleavage/methylation domain-containing protein